MDLTDFILTALAVAIGISLRDFAMGGLIAWRNKRTAEKRISELDKYYEALLQAEAAEANAAADESA